MYSKKVGDKKKAAEFLETFQMVVNGYQLSEVFDLKCPLSIVTQIVCMDNGLKNKKASKINYFSQPTKSRWIWMKIAMISNPSMKRMN